MREMSTLPPPPVERSTAATCRMVPHPLGRVDEYRGPFPSVCRASCEQCGKWGGVGVGVCVGGEVVTEQSCDWYTNPTVAVMQ